MNQRQIQMRAYFLSRVRALRGEPEDGAADWREAANLEQQLDERALRKLKTIPHRYGAYGSNRFYIRLYLPATLVDEDGALLADPSNETLALFAHEYAHFLQNTSTVSGWDSFERHIDLLRYFSDTLTGEGFCDPARLGPEDADAALELILAGRRARGNSSVRFPQNMVRVDVQSVGGHSPGKVPCDCCKVDWKCLDTGGNETLLSTTIGSRFVEEGIAYLLESTVRSRRASFQTVTAGSADPPFYPYLGYQVLCRHMAPSITATTAIRLGMLALNTHSPGCGLTKALAAYGARRAAGEDDNVAVTAVVSATVPEIRRTLSRVGAASQTIPSTFHGRAVLTAGAQYVAGWFRRGLTQRMKQLDFDIQWSLGNRLNGGALTRLLAQDRPCDVFQECVGRDGERQPDAWLTDGRQSSADRVGIRALQAQWHYLNAHIGERGFLSTEDADMRMPNPCPYVAFCTHARRRESPSVCARHPWADWQSDRCMYRVGVAETVGTTE